MYNIPPPIITVAVRYNVLARAIDPAHTSRDGDTIFAAATGVVEAPLDLVGVLAASVVADAIVRGVRAAAGAHES